MGKGKGPTARYYDRLKRTNPQKYKDTRIAQQINYNKHGSSKPGTKDITGNDISRNAVRLNRHFYTYAKNDGKDASHDCNGPGKHCIEDESINRARPHKGSTGSRKKNTQKNKRKLHITK